MTATLATDGVPVARVQQSLFSILRSNSLCALATESGDGTPHINTAFFAYDEDLNVFILTPPRADHSRYLAARPTSALAIYDSRQPWGTDLRGLQLFGRCRQVAGSEERRGLRLYNRRFPGLAEWAPTVEALEQHLESRFYAFSVERVKLFDEPTFGKEVWIEASVER